MLLSLVVTVPRLVWIVTTPPEMLEMLALSELTEVVTVPTLVVRVAMPFWMLTRVALSPLIALTTPPIPPALTVKRSVAFVGTPVLCGVYVTVQFQEPNGALDGNTMCWPLISWSWNSTVFVVVPVNGQAIETNHVVPAGSLMVTIGPAV